ncbi:MAG: MFS transporter [Candidatus Rokubacteria bacterium]|nr:MFS transporter [Candidatus Rokubacteria bacterium]
MQPRPAPPPWLPWVMWGIPAFIFLVAFFHRVAPGTVAKELMASFQASGALLGLLSALYFYAYAALMLPAGLLVDAYGPRRVVAVGGSFMGIGTLLMGWAWSSWPLFAGRLLVGLGASVTFVGALKVAAVWFSPRWFGTLSAITATMGVLGALVATAPFALLAGMIGWRWAFVSVGLISLCASLLCWAMVRDGPGAAEAALQSLGEIMKGTWRVLSNRHTWPPFLTFFGLYSASSNLMLWGIPFFRDVYGLPIGRAAIYATAPLIAILFSAPLTGYLSDRVLGRRRLPYVALCWLSVLLWGTFVLTLGRLSLSGLYSLLFVTGAFGGAFVLTWPIGREVNPPPLAGVSVAVVNLGGFLGAALTQAPVGALLDSRWTGAMEGGARVYPLEAYRLAFAICALLVLGAALVAFLVKETRGQNIYDTLFPSHDGALGLAGKP